MQELILRLNTQFSDTDKENAVPTVNKMVDLANLARMKGVLALELEMEQEENVFLKTGIELVVDGTDPILVEQILQNLILSGNYSGAELLNRLVIAEGVLGLQKGENPRLLTLMLGSMLGEDYLPRLINSAPENKMRGCIDFLGTLRNKKILFECTEFEEKLLQMDYRSIQLVIKNLSANNTLHWTLPYALYGCGFELVYKILFYTMSQNKCIQICEELEKLEGLSADAVLQSQSSILKVIEELENRGEIIRACSH